MKAITKIDNACTCQSCIKYFIVHVLAFPSFPIPVIISCARIIKNKISIIISYLQYPYMYPFFPYLALSVIIRENIGLIFIILQYCPVFLFSLEYASPWFCQFVPSRLMSISPLCVHPTWCRVSRLSTSSLSVLQGSMWDQPDTH